MAIRRLNILPFFFCCSLLSAQEVPATVSRHAEPEMPHDARSANIQGTVGLLVTISASGNVDEAYVVKQLDREFDASALRGVRKWKFRPAMRNGVPFATHAVIEVRFGREGIPQDRVAEQRQRDFQKAAASRNASKLKALASSGFIPARYLYAELFGSRDPELAAKYLDDAVKAEYGPALYRKAMSQIETSPPAAIEMLRLASGRGAQAAHFQLAGFYERGIHVPRDPVQASPEEHAGNGGRRDRS